MNFNDRSMEMVWKDLNECAGMTQKQIIDAMVAEAAARSKVPIDRNWNGEPNVYLRGKYEVDIVAKEKQRCVGIGLAMFIGTEQDAAELRMIGTFSQAMWERIKANRHKGGWKQDDPYALLARIARDTRDYEDNSHFEFEELCDAVDECCELDGPIPPVLDEAADIANFAMMIADVCGALVTESEDS